MLFNSFLFLIFFAAVLFFYYLVPNNTYKRCILILAAIYFILQTGVVSLIIITLSAIFNYFTGIEIEKRKDTISGKFIFIAGIIVNTGNLFVFKYYNFFNENLQELMGQFHLSSPFPAMELLLPLGISFYTFQLLSYLVDIRLKNTAAEKNIIIFLNYVFFFPKLLAGPIERARNFLPQEHSIKQIRWEDVSAGGKLIIWGFFQKVVIADRISNYVDAVYNNLEVHHGITLTVCAVLYTFQVYADFSGYTDIARGISRLLGYDLMINFNRPLLARSVTEFWRRWHISLSSWVNDYIYTPLSLSFRGYGMRGIIFSLFISFFIVGIWHGARWTFVAFGLLQGVILTFEMITLKRRKRLFDKIPKSLVRGGGILITYILIALSFIFFRSGSLEQAYQYISKISFSGRLFLSIDTLVYSFLGIIVLVLHDIMKEFFSRDLFRIKSGFYLLRTIPYAILLIMIILAGVFDGGQFIYFQF